MCKLHCLVVLAFVAQLTKCAPSGEGMLSDEGFKPVSFKMEDAVTPFIGRVAELSELEWKQVDNKLAVVTGLRGVGKSELVRKYAENFKLSNPGASTVWIKSESTSETFSEMNELAASLGISTEGKKKLAILREVFGHFDGQKVLFIFDNAPDSNAVLIYLPRILGDAKKIYVVVTSRSDNWSKDYSMLKLEPFSTAEAVEYLKTHLTAKVSDAKYEQLAKALENVPLALQKSSYYINEESKKGSYTVDDFLDDLQGKRVPSTTETAVISPPEEPDEDLLAQLEEESAKLGQKIAQEATKAWETVSQGAEHAWSKVSSGASHAGEQIAAGAKQAGHEVAKVAQNVGSSVKSWFG